MPRQTVPRPETADDPVARHYDALDAFFREVWGEHVHHGFWETGRETWEAAVGQLVGRVAAELRLSPGMTVCDIGCGYGATARWLATERGATVTAVTNSVAQRDYALALEGGENPRYVLGDWLRGEWPEGAFDAAVALESAEHMREKDLFFAQAHRVLRARGRLVVTGWQRGAGAGASLIGPICRAARMPPLLSEGAYVQAAEAAGFKLLHLQDWTRQVAPTWLRMGWVLSGRLWRRPSLARHLVRNWRFALAALEITAAFRLGALRYRVMTFEREG